MSYQNQATQAIDPKKHTWHSHRILILRNIIIYKLHMQTVRQILNTDIKTEAHLIHKAIIFFAYKCAACFSLTVYKVSPKRCVWITLLWQLVHGVEVTRCLVSHHISSGWITATSRRTYSRRLFPFSKDAGSECGIMANLSERTYVQRTKILSEIVTTINEILLLRSKSFSLFTSILHYFCIE